MQEVQDQALLDQLHAGSAANARDWLEAVQRAHAGAWLSAYPCKALGLWMPSEQFRACSRLWPGRQEGRALRKTGLEMYGRHHALRDCLVDK
eukprot:4528633-Karenia_brevis.AAC.1